jgi:hypothetical protein
MTKTRKNTVADFHDTIAEQCVLAAYLTDFTLSVHLVTPDLFYIAKHRIIWESIYSLRNCGVASNLQAVVTDLRTRDRLLDVEIDYLARLTDHMIPSTANVEYYIDVLKQAALNRDLMTLTMQMQEQITSNAHFGNGDICERIRTLVNGTSFAAEPKIKYQTSRQLAQTVFPEQKWFVPGIVPEGLTILAGPPKVKKSWFALNIALAVATGGKVLGSLPVEQHSVLFISLEDGGRRIQKRQELMGCPQGTDNLYLAYDWQGGCTELRNFLSEHREVKFVITDTLFLFSGTNRKGIKDMNAYSETSEATKALKKIAQEFGVGIMAITHTNKSSSCLDSPASMNDIIGSQGTAGGADTILVMKKGKTGNNTVDLYLNGKDLEEESVKTLQWDSDLCAWKLLGEKSEVILGETQKKIAEALENEGALPSAKLYKVLKSEYGYDSSDSAMRTVLTRMVHDGKLYLKDKLYSLTPFTAEEKEERPSLKTKASPPARQKDIDFCELRVAPVADVAKSANKKSDTATHVTGKNDKNEAITLEQVIDELFGVLSKVPMSISDMIQFCNNKKAGAINQQYMAQAVQEGIKSGTIEVTEDNKYRLVNQ